MFFGEYSIFYIITIVLQAICVIHSIRKGTQQKWLWIIIFIPVIGAIIYMFSEIFSRGDLKNVRSGVVTVINPGGIIRKLEDRLRFADTFQNRVMLADAYLQAGMTEKAIAFYEASLTGNFSENEHVLMQLCLAYTDTQQYDKTIIAARKILQVPQFARSSAHIAYAISLGKVGDVNMAEAEFKKMCGKFANYEARYQYGMMLKEDQRLDEARQIWQQMVVRNSICPERKGSSISNGSRQHRQPCRNRAAPYHVQVFMVVPHQQYVHPWEWKFQTTTTLVCCSSRFGS